MKKKEKGISIREENRLFNFKIILAFACWLGAIIHIVYRDLVFAGMFILTGFIWLYSSYQTHKKLERIKL